MSSSDIESFVERVNGTSRLRIEHDFGGGFVRLHTSEAQRRQAIQDIRTSEDIVLELMRNAKDAHAAHVFVATGREGGKRTIVVIDDGEGIPEEMHEVIFEPRVTSKLDTSHVDHWGFHGRGMALYSIAVNTTSAYIASSAKGVGCAIRVDVDLQTIGEKTDQSTFPTFELADERTVNVRGPRNLLRTACEFALQTRQTCSVTIGSVAEICSALYRYGAETLSPVDRLFCSDEKNVPLVKRLATADSPRSLAHLAQECGLDISERTARRVMDGQVAPARPALDCVTIAGTAGNPGQNATGGDKAAKRMRRRPQKPIKLTSDERRDIAESARDIFAPVAQRYYLEPDVMPGIAVHNDALVISIPIVRKNDPL